MYEFQSEGFFGYGEMGDFSYWSPAHLIPIFLLLAAITATFRFRESIASLKHEGRFRAALSFAIFLSESSYYWRVLYAGSGHADEPNLLLMLPLQVCEWGAICAIFMLLTENKTLFNFNYYLTVLSVAACITPGVIMTTGPSYFRYYQYWGEHMLPIYAVCYMMAVRGLRPDYKGLWKTIFALILLSIPCVIANRNIPGASYMYLSGETYGDTFASMIPGGMFEKYLIFFVITVSLFHIEYFIARKLFREESHGL